MEKKDFPYTTVKYKYERCGWVSWSSHLDSLSLGLFTLFTIFFVLFFCFVKRGEMKLGDRQYKN